jgi:signal transduction histidine kinase
LAKLVNYAERALREADRKKDEFLATLAHELRNPLAPVLTASSLLASPNISSTQLNWISQVIQRQVNQMKLLLDDLLDVSRITLGKLTPRFELVTLSDLVATSVETAKPLIERKHHQLDISLPSEPVHFTGDPLRLAQIVSNLLTNAAKYTPEGGVIWLSATVDEADIKLFVRDNGLGIAPELLGHIFSMFSQIHEASIHSEGGLGIGLALSSGLASLHGGEITAHSDGPGKGSEFTLRLPRHFSPLDK